MDTETERPALERLALRAELVRLVIEASDSDISVEGLAAAGGSLSAFGYSSLSYIRLIDRIENELGAYIDPEADADMFATVDGIVALVLASRDGVDV
jgi:acyl carrier protein